MSWTWKAPGYKQKGVTTPMPSQAPVGEPSALQQILSDLSLQTPPRQHGGAALPDVSNLSIESTDDVVAADSGSGASDAERNEADKSAHFKDVSGPDKSFDPAGATVDHSATTTGGGHSQVSSEVNVQDRFELFLLGDGEKKVEETPDTRTANTSIFKFNKEDHTLANLLRAYLLKDAHVNFCGYRVPHPLFANFELRVQTDGEITPKEALNNCCQSIVGELGHLSREFTKEFELRKMVQGEDGTAK